MSWIFYSFLYALFLGIVTVMFKLVGQNFHFLEMGIVMSFITSCILFIIAIPKLPTIKFMNSYIILIGVVYGIFNYFFIKTILAYHNPGVVSALVRSQIFFTFVLGTIFFKFPFSWKKFVIIIILIFGAIITILDFKKKDQKEGKLNTINKFLQILNNKNIDIKKLNKSQLKEIIESNSKDLDLDKETCLSYILQLQSSKYNQLDFKKYTWIIYLIITVITYTCYDLITKFRPAKFDISLHNLFVMISYFSVFLLIYLGEHLYFFMVKKKYPMEPVNVKNKYKYISNFRKYGQLVLLGVMYVGLIVCLNKAIDKSPTPASAKGIGSCGVLVSLILSYFIFKEIPDKNQIIGCTIILICSICLGFI